MQEKMDEFIQKNQKDLVALPLLPRLLNTRRIKNRKEESLKKEEMIFITFKCLNDSDFQHVL